eukprot:g4640.t1
MASIATAAAAAATATEIFDSPSTSTSTKMQTTDAVCATPAPVGPAIIATPGTSTPAAAPAATPAATPTALSTPKEDQEKQLQGAIASAEQSLQTIWDEVGLASADRARLLRELREKLLQTVQGVLTEEQELRDAYVTRVEESVAQIETMKAQLEMVKKEGGEGRTTVGRAEGETLTDSVTRLEKELGSISRIHGERTQCLGGLLEEIHALYSTLGMEIEENFAEMGFILSAEREAEMREKVSSLKAEKAVRVEGRDKLCKEISDLMLELVVEPETEMDMCIFEAAKSVGASVGASAQFGLTIADLSALSNRAAELAALKVERETHITELAKQINVLWDKLDIAQEERSAFLEQHNGLGEAEIKACEEELVRMKELKMQRLVPLVHKCREQITALWEELHFRPSAEICKISDEDMTESVLEEHESYIETLKRRAEQQRPIMELINKRERILREREELESPSEARNLDSRSRNNFKRLAREEKMRKRIKVLLPKLTEELLGKLEEWKQEYEAPLTFDGEEYLQRMRRQKEEYVAKKNAEKQRKEDEKKARLAAMKNPHPSAAKPSSRRNRPAPLMRRSKENHSVSHHQRQNNKNKKTAARSLSTVNRS